MRLKATMAGLVAALALPLAGLAKETPRGELTTALAALSHADEMDGRGPAVEARDGYMFVQCRRMPHEASVTCEATGPRGQPWMRHPLTKERRAALKELGFAADRKTGNFIDRLDVPPSAQALADLMIAALVRGYGSDEADIRVDTGSFPAVACPPRYPAGGQFGGEVIARDRGLGAPVEGCEVKAVKAEALASSRLPRPLPVAPMGAGDAQDVMESNVAALTDAVGWLMDGTPTGTRVASFDWGDLFIRCLKPRDPVVVCEVESAEENPNLRHILTPAVGRKLQAMGFREPGYTMNYSRRFAADKAKTPEAVKVLAQAAMEAFGGYVLLPLDVKRYVSAGA
ncbi:MAG: hypothetical protein PW843_23520 [Azospirillaceae bacterium]|nr:hypothetical protein [Azospirillaceae bacterium]